MTKARVSFFAALLAINLEAVAQVKDKPVAIVGDEKITQQEFKLRYELVPHLSSDQWNIDSSKKDLLYSIIAEKLLAQEARRLGYSETDYFKESIKQIRDLNTRDALYKKVIAAKVQITDADIQNALNRYSQTLEVKIISAGDSSTIFGYYKQVQNGVPFDSIEKYSDAVEYDSNKAPIKVTYGQMGDDFVEDTLYNLRPGSFSYPVKTEGGWFIFKLVGVQYRVPPNVKDPDYNKSILEVIRMRKSRLIGMRYLDNFYKDKKAVVDSVLFWDLAKRFSSILSEKKRSNEYGEEGYLYLSEGNLMQIAGEIGNSVLEKELVHIEGSPIKLKEYLYSLIVYPYLIKDPSLMATAYHLMENINRYVQYKFLAAEAINEGLPDLPEVKEDVDIWVDDYLAKMLKNTFRDSVHVSDQDVRDFYYEEKGGEKVDIMEILNDNVDTVTSLLKRISAGEDFGKLASEYTKRSWTKANGGEFGYFPVDSFGPIGKTAKRLKIGESYGPIKTDSGYSIIKLVGRKLENKEREQVNIVEILTHSLDTVETVFRQLDKGKDFRELAARYTERTWTKNDTGEFGYFSVYSFGDIGRIASNLTQGQIYGPIVTDSGYSIIKLIGKRYDTTKTEQDFESRKKELREELLEKKFNEKFFGYVAGLAERYKYSINQESLNEVKVINIPMFTYRYIGFGGRITALPYLGTWGGWVKYLNNKSGIVP
jgi:foldase protein PrsA